MSRKGGQDLGAQRTLGLVKCLICHCKGGAVVLKVFAIDLLSDIEI